MWNSLKCFRLFFDQSQIIRNCVGMWSTREANCTTVILRHIQYDPSEYESELTPSTSSRNIASPFMFVENDRMDKN
jgi:hypothetical protein